MDKYFNDALNCLIHNERLTKLITETIGNIERSIDSLNDSQEYLNSQVKCDEVTKSTYLSQILNGENMCRVRRPFFSSNNGLIPFTNETEKRRIIDSSHDYYMLKYQAQKICTEKEFDALKVAVGKNIYDIECERLIKSKDKQSDKKLKALRSSSFYEISQRCDDAMIERIDWMTISSQDLKGKISPADCRRLWEKVFNPQYVYTKWSEAESQRLLEVTSELGSEGKWVEIASKLSTRRQPFVCYRRWLELTSKMETSDEWTAEEDEVLCYVVNRLKDKTPSSPDINWNKVAIHLSNRSAKDCDKRWISLKIPINNRPFSDDEDYQLLLLIKKLGTENWTEIARELTQRTGDQCQKRYCEIVEELHPWSYFEDRRLWLLLRTYFRNLWTENSNRLVEVTSNIMTYKIVIKGFNGRCPVVLRHRYGRLCKWFHLWSQYYQTLCPGSSKVSSLLAESSEELDVVVSKVLRIILRTSFFDRIKNALYSIGSKDADSEAHELIMRCKHGNSESLTKLIKESTNQKLIDLLMFIMDLQNGVFIPTNIDDYVNKPCSGFKYPERATANLRCHGTNVRGFTTKEAISKSLKKSFSVLMNDERISSSDKSCIIKMLECEGKFSAALNFACKNLEKTHNFKFTSKADLLEKFLPQLLRLMVQYTYNQERCELAPKTPAIHFNLQLTNKREQIAELLIYRETIQTIYKTYVCTEKKGKCFSLMFLPQSIVNTLMSKEKLKFCSMNTMKILKAQQMHPSTDINLMTQTLPINNIPLLPQNRNTTNLLRTLILQKLALMTVGGDSFKNMMLLKYDNPAKNLQTGSNTSLVALKSSILLDDPRYLLLRSRLLSILAIPSIVARISPFACAFSADKLHQEQNNVAFSTEISDAFNIVNLSNSAFDLSLEGNIDYRECKVPKNVACRASKIRHLLDSEIVQPVSSHTNRNHVVKLSGSQPLTRRCGRSWVKLHASESGRYFFVSKHIFRDLARLRFTVDSMTLIENVNE